MAKRLITIPVIFADSNWQQCFEHFLAACKRRSGSNCTVDSYCNILHRFFSAGKAPESVCRADIESFIVKKGRHNTKSADGTPAVSTTNARLTALSSFFTFASAYTVPGPDGQPVPLFNRANPTARIAHGEPSRVYKTLSQSEIAAFFSVIPHDTRGARDRALFYTYLVTCRRASELYHLKWQDVERTIIADDDGTTREAYIFKFRCKGHSGLESQELPQECYALILRYLEISGRLATIRPDDPVFIAHGPDIGGSVKPGEIRQLSHHGIVYSLQRYASAAGIDTKKLSIHSFRHTGAYLRKIIGGEDLLSISRVLKHRSVATTQRYLEGLSTNADKGSQAVTRRLAALGIM